MNWLNFLFPFLGLMTFAGETDGASSATLEEGDEGDSETPKDSSTEGTEGEAESGEDVKTQEPSDEEVEKGLLESGDSIPYDRFKQFVTKRNAKVSELSTKLEDLQSELEELNELRSNPEVYKAILKAQGVTDPKIIGQKLQEVGLQTEEEIPENELFKKFSEGVDLTKTEGWLAVMTRIAKHFSHASTAPIEGKLQETATREFIKVQESKAQELAKKVGIPYGEAGKDERNPNTCIGKMMSYFKSLSPEEQTHIAKLGHVALLKQALFEEGISIGKLKGKKEEQARNEDLKRSAMEDEAIHTSPKRPSSDASISELMDYARKNIT